MTNLEHLKKTPTLNNANSMLNQIRELKDENFQLVQEMFLTTLISLLDNNYELKSNEIKTTLVKCINLILLGSKLTKDLHYKILLIITLKQIFDFPSNSYKSNLSEEQKIATFECLEISSRRLDSDVVETFMVNENKILLSQCVFVCKEAIMKEKYLKIRKCATEAIMSLMQLHDKADFNDIVLRDQISKMVFIMLPQVSAALLNVCLESSFKASNLIAISTKVFGRYLCLVFEDYEKKSIVAYSSEDFVQLLKNSQKLQKDDDSVLQTNSKNSTESIANLTKSEEWINAASRKIAPTVMRLKKLQGSEHEKIRFELAHLSWNLLNKCLINIQSFAPFLLENLILFSDDSEERIKELSWKSLQQLSINYPAFNQKIDELFLEHLKHLPIIIINGDESEQIAGFTLLNSFIINIVTIKSENSQLDFILDNPLILAKLIENLLSCCELEVPNDLLFYENLTMNTLQDDFYKMKKPWKCFKYLKTTAVIKKFSEICQNIGKSQSAKLFITHLQDNMDCLEYLVLLIEIIDGKNENSALEEIVEEFLDQTYWTMPIFPSERICHKPKKDLKEEWFKDTTPGLYESAIEVRLRDVSLEDEDDYTEELTLKRIKYNILSTCLVVEFIGTLAKILEKKFQRFLLRSLHKVLEKAGNSNFIVRTSGLEALQNISDGMGFKDVSKLIDEHSDFLLFNIKKLLRNKDENDAVIDMLSVIFKVSQSSMTAYVKDIIDTIADRIVDERKAENASHLKMFHLYVSSIKYWQKDCFNDTEIDKTEVKFKWDEFLEQCKFELENDEEIMKVNENIEESKTVNEENCSEDVNEEEIVDEKMDEKTLPPHIELIIKIFNSSLQFFASTNPTEVILTHEIFLEGLPILHLYEDEFLPIVHQMWYPFTKQFQGKNLVVLRNSFRLLVLLSKLAKSFILKRATNEAIPVLNNFLRQTFKSTDKKENLFFTQEFKLQHEILSGYASLIIDLEVDDKGVDEIVDIIMRYTNHSNETISKTSKNCIETLKTFNSGLIHFKKILE
ncbi:CLUMA_CG004116, isoform A [Clunio marinus]|uniref:CLUMA_CG004116, isoform A n=1 Tax=Clunio marinus TaxID=568069 RepID=A0A1J1HQZ1_9DIPT|nr:CLUMA_CG004116, isoform A [Clunio marinus]